MHRKLSIYTAAFIITLIGSGATMLIVNTAYSTAEAMELDAIIPSVHADLNP